MGLPVECRERCQIELLSPCSQVTQITDVFGNNFFAADLTVSWDDGMQSGIVQPSLQTVNPLVDRATGWHAGQWCLDRVSGQQESMFGHKADNGIRGMAGQGVELQSQIAQIKVVLVLEDAIGRDELHCLPDPWFLSLSVTQGLRHILVEALPAVPVANDGERLRCEGRRPPDVIPVGMAVDDPQSATGQQGQQRPHIVGMAQGVPDYSQIPAKKHSAPHVIIRKTDLR